MSTFFLVDCDGRAPVQLLHTFFRQIRGWLCLLATVLPVLAVAGTFPSGEPFNGMRIQYSVTGATLGAPKDQSGFTTRRTLEGFTAGDRVNFSVTAASAWEGIRSAYTFAGPSQSSFEDRVMGPSTRSFTATATIPPGGSASFTARIELIPTGSGGFIESRFLEVIVTVRRPALVENMNLTAQSPLADAKNVPVGMPITIQFSKEVEPTTVHQGTILLSYPSNPSAIITTSWQVKGRTVTINPQLSRIGKRVKVAVRGGEDGIRGIHGEQLAGTRSWIFTTAPDLSVAILPVQAVEGVALIKDKPGVVRVKANWPDADGALVSDVDKLTADVTVTYDNNQTFKQTGHIFYRKDRDREKKMGMPPLLQKKGNAAHFYSQSNQMPIVSAPGAHTIQAVVKPVGAFGSTAAYTNQVAVNVLKFRQGWLSTYDGLSILMVPVNLGGWQPGETRSTAAMGRECQRILKNMFPVADVRVDAQDAVWDIHPGPLLPLITGFQINNLLRNLARYGSFRHHAIVGVVPTPFLTNALGARGITGDILWTFAHRSAFVGDTNSPMIPVHEIGHTLQYNHSDSPQLLGYNLADDRYVSSADALFGYNKDLMDADISAAHESQVWVAQAPYQQFMSKLATDGSWFSRASRGDAPQPKGESSNAGLLFIDVALIRSNGAVTASIDSIFAGDGGFLSDQPGTGPAVIAIKDAGETVLQSCAFEPEWRTNDTDQTEYAFFLAVLPGATEASQVSISLDGTTLATKIRSPAAPTVAVTAPTAGSTVSGTTTVVWIAADADNDPLTTVVSYSPDAGQNWLPLHIGVTNASSIAFDTTSQIGGTQSLVRVQVTDGFRTTSATSGLFTVCNPPHIIDRIPAPGETQADPNRPLTVYFRDELDPATLTTNALRVFSMATNPVVGVTTYDAAERALVFTPDAPFLCATSYFAVVKTNDLRDSCGLPLPAQVQWTFTTAADTSPPEWTALGPEPGSTEVPRRQGVFVAFNEPMNVASITNGGLTLRPTGGAELSGICTYDPTTRVARFTPTVPLNAFADYEGVLSSNVCDRAGNPIDSTNLVWSFTTGEEMEYLGIRILEFQDYQYLDNNSDGLWDRLQIRFRVEVLGEGDYGLSAALAPTNQEAQIAQAVQTPTHLLAGTGSLTAYFEGEALRLLRPLNSTVQIAALGAYNAANHANSGFLGLTDVFIPVMNDLDGDGIEDSWEAAHGLSFTNAADAGEDWDADRLTNLEEYRRGFDFNNPDMDNDGLIDGWEVLYGFNPTNTPPGWIREVPLTLTGAPPSPGTCRALALESNLLYVTTGGNGLSIYDVSLATNPVSIGWVDTPGDTFDVAIQYPWAFAANQPYGVQVIDISTPTNPVLQTTYSTGPITYSVDVRSNLLAVADRIGGVSLWNVTDALHPVLLSTNAVPAAYHVQLVSNRLYVVERDSAHAALDVFDISNPAAPVQQGAYANSELANSFVSGTNAYLAMGVAGLGIADVHDPANMTLLATTNLPIGMAGVATPWNHLAFVGGQTGIAVVDISEAAGPIFRSAFATSQGVFDLFVNSNCVFTAENNDGIRIYSWTETDHDRDGLPDDWERRYFGHLNWGAQDDPDGDNIPNIGEWRTDLNPDASDEDHNGRRDDLDMALELRDPSNSDRDGDGLSDQDEIYIHGTSPFLPDSDGDGWRDDWELTNGFNPLVPDSALDADGDFLTNWVEFQLGTHIRNPDTDGDSLPDGWEVRYGFDPFASIQPIPGATFEPLAVLTENFFLYDMDVAVASNRAYSVNGTQLRVLDLTDPANPVVTGAFLSVGGYRIAVQDNRAYVSSSEGFGAFHMFDLGSGADPVYLNSIYTYGPPVRDADLYGGYACLAVDGWGVAIYDVADPLNPQYAGELATPDIVRDVCAVSNLMYLASSAGGLQIISLSAAGVPTSVGSWPCQALAVQVQSNRAYMADAGQGLRILDVGNPAAPTLLGTYTTTKAINDLEIRGPRAYLSCDASGLEIVDVANPTAPVRIAETTNWSGLARGLDLFGDNVVAASYLGGLHVMQYTVPDADQDGMLDTWEMSRFASLTNAANGDFDDDGLHNGAEYETGMAPDQSDQNTNAINDGVEVWQYLLDPRAAPGGDLDGDGINNEDEVFLYGSNPAKVDSDGDGMPDAWEVLHSLNPASAADAALDPDGDGLPNLSELQHHTDPHVFDSDVDGLPDGWEAAYGHNPADAPGRLTQVGIYYRGEHVAAAAVEALDASTGSLLMAGEMPSPRVLNLSDPNKPVTLASTPGGINRTRMLAQSNLVYLTGYNLGMDIVDISQPANPVKKGYYPASPYSYTGPVAVRSNMAYVASWGLDLVDVSVPTNPVLLRTLPDEFPQCMAWRGSQLHTYGARRIGGQYEGAYRIMDATDPTNLVDIGACPLTALSCNDMIIAGDYAYLALVNDGIYVMDLRSPTNPVVAAHFPSEVNYYDLVRSSNYLFAVSYTTAVHVIDIRNPTNLFECGRFDVTDMNPRAIAVRSSHVYVGLVGVWGDNPNLLTFEYRQVDTDDDGLADWWEQLNFGTLAHGPDYDPDGDGIPALGEFRAMLNTFSNDQDQDGLNDGEEVRVHGTDPTRFDTDCDRLPDGLEITLGSDPLRADTDGDGISDGDEVFPPEGVPVSNPTLADSDGDGMMDRQERIAGTDPLDPLSLFEFTKTRNSSSRPVIEWPSASNRLYRIDRSSNLTAGFSVLLDGISATPPLNVHTDTTATTRGPWIYRLKVE